MSKAVRIIGIDPGLRRCGWGIIESEGNRLVFIACGTLLFYKYNPKLIKTSDAFMVSDVF